MGPGRQRGLHDLAFADPDPGKNHYYVSVTSRAPAIRSAARSSRTATSVTVYVNQHPIETAQITILIFNDNAPINNAPDLPTEEPGLGPGQTDMSGFQIIVEDAGGRFGASAGVMSPGCLRQPAVRRCLRHRPRRPTDHQEPGPRQVRHPGGAARGQGWQQTATIEGTKVIDAWVKAGEPPFFAEFGPPGYHVFIGFVKPFNDISTAGGTPSAAPSSTSTCRGRRTTPSTTAGASATPPRGWASTR
jgi:large repetitive protein